LADLSRSLARGPNIERTRVAQQTAFYTNSPVHLEVGFGANARHRGPAESSPDRAGHGIRRAAGSPDLARREVRGWRTSSGLAGRRSRLPLQRWGRPRRRAASATCPPPMRVRILVPRRLHRLSRRQRTAAPRIRDSFRTSVGCDIPQPRCRTRKFSPTTKTRARAAQLSESTRDRMLRRQLREPDRSARSRVRQIPIAGEARLAPKRRQQPRAPRGP